MFSLHNSLKPTFRRIFFPSSGLKRLNEGSIWYLYVLAPLAVLIGSIDDGKFKNILYTPTSAERRERKKEYYMLPSLTF